MSSEDRHLSVDAKAGDEFEVRLEATSGTGAIWYYTPEPGGPELVREDRRPSPEPGGPSVQAFVLRSPSSGEHLLNFELKQIWNSVVRRRASVTARVT